MNSAVAPPSISAGPAPPRACAAGRRSKAHGFLITHAEAISIPDYLTLRDGGEVSYRPTVYYVYHPCDAAVLSIHELAGKNWRLQKQKRIIVDDVASGTDELGVLLMGYARKSYWYGSRPTPPFRWHR